MKPQVFVPPAALLTALAGAALAVPPTAFPPVFSTLTLDGDNGFRVVGPAGATSLGRGGVGPLGDLDGDGIDDLLIGASNLDSQGLSNNGGVFVVFGGPGIGASGAIELADPFDGFQIQGAGDSDLTGFAVADAGDFDGDGITDLILGSPFRDIGGLSDAGQATVVFGRNVSVEGAFPSVIPVGTLNNADGIDLDGFTADEDAGVRVSGAGDVNGDGIDDVLVATNAADGYTGEVYVVFGAPNIGASGDIDLGALDGSNGFTVIGDSAGDQAGSAARIVGDINADGLADIGIGAPDVEVSFNASAGEAYVLFGSPSVGFFGEIDLPVNSGEGLRFRGLGENDELGFAMDGAGDFNGDGFDDLVMSARFQDSGTVYVVYGGPGVDDFALTEFDGTNGFAIPALGNDTLGQSVSGGGDLNADGYDDLVVYAGIPRVVYVVFGGPDIAPGGTLDLATLDGVSGFAVVAGTLGDGDLARDITIAGDVNADGIDDLVCVASGGFTDPPGAGEVYVIFGRNYQRWVGPADGSYDDPAVWLGQRPPMGGAVFIEPDVGVTVAGPAGGVYLDSLTIGAGNGRTTLDLAPGSVVSTEATLSLPGSAAVVGAGTLASSSQIVVEGLLRLDDMEVFADGGINVLAGGRVQATRGVIDGSITNAGVLELESLGKAGSTNELEMLDGFTNSSSGQIFVFGDAILRFNGNLTSFGDLDLVASSSIVTGQITNLGDIAVLLGSAAVFTGDVQNLDVIVVSADSTLTVLGTLSGNGVTGTAAGQAGPTSLLGGLEPGGAARAVARFDGDVSLGPLSTTTIEIASTKDLDKVVTTGALAAGGDLIVTLDPGFKPQPGDVYDVLDFASLTGSFSIVQLDQTLIDLGADISDLLVTGEIRVPGELCPGDVDGDNDTDVFDFAELALAFGTMPGDTNWNPDADLVPNGTIDVFDFATLAEDFGCSD